MVDDLKKTFNSIKDEWFDTARDKRGSSGIVVHNYTQQSMTDRIEQAGNIYEENKKYKKVQKKW